MHAVVAQAGFADSPGHREPQHVSAAARRMRFFARHHIRRTHRPGKLLTAGPHAAAHLDRAAHAAVFGVVEPRGGIRRLITGAEAQIRREWRRIHNLAGIQDAQRIESLLDLAERLV